MNPDSGALRCENVAPCGDKNEGETRQTLTFENFAAEKPTVEFVGHDQRGDGLCRREQSLEPSFRSRNAVSIAV